MPIIVTDIPSDFVDYLTDPGLPVYDMNIPLIESGVRRAGVRFAGCRSTLGSQNGQAYR